MILAYLEQEYKALKSNDALTAKGLIDRYVEKVIIYEKDFEAIFKILHTTGGGGGSRTPVRKKDQRSFYERIS